MKVAFHTLGCKVNQYESEAMAKMFREAGHEIVGEREFADVYVINTCTVTAVADKKSRQYIRRMKKVNPDSIVAVTGCYAQIKPEEVASVAGVDIVTGTNEKHTLPQYVEEFARQRGVAKAGKGDAGLDLGERVDESSGVSALAIETGQNDWIHIREWEDLNTYEDTGLVTSAENRTRAYIKIQEGCNRFCSYCVIPYARGNIRSRDLAEIVEEAKQLITAGYKELVLTGINTALYGMEGIGRPATEMPVSNETPDTKEESSATVPGTKGEVPATVPGTKGEVPATVPGTKEEALDTDPGSKDETPAAAPAGLYGVERVIAALDALPGEFRIRLSSLEPAVVNAGYVQRLLKYRRLCRHLHLSAQSGSDRVLRAMNRPYDRAGYLKIVETVRAFDPLYGISTDIIVGFPGEKETDLQESVSLVEQCDFCRTHVFRYSRRPKTKAAEMKNQVSPQVKNRRSDVLQEAGSRALTSFCMKNLGEEKTVLVEEFLPQQQMVTGFTDNYIRAYIRCTEEEAQGLLNTFRRVKLTEIHRDGCMALIL